MIIFGITVSGSLFGVTAGLAVWRYGGSTTANILQVVGSGYAIRAAILIAALQLCFSSAIGHSALFQNLEDRLHVNRCEFYNFRHSITSEYLKLAVVALADEKSKNL